MNTRPAGRLITLKGTAQELLINAPAETRGLSRSVSLEDEVIAFFDLYRAPVLRYLISLRIPVPDAEEIVQEVFLALFRHLHAGKSRSNLAGWIFTVSHNMARKYQTSDRRRARYFADELFAVDRFESPDEDPEQQLDWKQYRGQLKDVVRALPEQDRHCLALRAEGFRYREIARILGISLGSVANSLARALRRLSRVQEVNR